MGSEGEMAEGTIFVKPKSEKTAQDPEEQILIIRAHASFLQYKTVTHYNCTHQRRDAFFALPEAHWKRLADPPFNYLETLDKVDKAIESNAELGEAIVRAGIPVFLEEALTKAGLPDYLSAQQTPGGAQGRVRFPPQWRGYAKHSDVDKARSALRQFYRDWSAAGATEREACYGPVIKRLQLERSRRKDPKPSDPNDLGQSPIPPLFNVLVPGAGLGRLVFELARDGFGAEGNEVSYHQLLAASYMLKSSPKPGQHTLYPWVHTFSNHRSRENHLRGYPVPDVNCVEELKRAEQEKELRWSMQFTASDFLCLYSDMDHKERFDAVASVFFLDTAPNVTRYLETIHHCLKPGGLLINNGPLLWHFENSVGRRGGGDGETGDTTGIAEPGRVELTDDELMALVEQMGFVVEERETGRYAPYIHDPESMNAMMYRSSFWVARKSEKSPEEVTNHS